MAILRRSTKIRREKHKPEVVTGDFELHFEDVVNRNRYALVAVLASGFVLLAVFVPTAVYHSVAGNDKVSIEAESGSVINPDLVEIVDNDMTASDNGYIEFRLTKPSTP